jgi:hypothetical protein
MSLVTVTRRLCYVEQTHQKYITFILANSLRKCDAGIEGFIVSLRDFQARWGVVQQQQQPDNQNRFSDQLILFILMR